MVSEELLINIPYFFWNHIIEHMILRKAIRPRKVLSVESVGESVLPLRHLPRMADDLQSADRPLFLERKLIDHHRDARVLGNVPAMPRVWARKEKK